MNVRDEELPIIIENSPVSFAIMGPGKRHRRVLVRSRDENLDLIELDGGPPPNYRRSRANIFRYLLASEAQSHFRYIVRSRSEHVIDREYTDRDDERKTNISFAWRGIVRVNDDALENIEGNFRRISLDLDTTIKEGFVSEIEWQIAPLITLCAEATAEAQRRRRVGQILLYGFIFLYLGMVAYLVSRVTLW